MPLANLVIQTAFLGDLLLSVPVLRQIKKKFPQEHLIVLCKKGVGEFLIKQGIADQIIEIEKSNSESYSQALGKLDAYDIKNLFCLHRSVRSLLFSSRVKAKTKIGFSSFLGFWIFDETVEHISENPEAIRQFKILEPVDTETASHFNRSSFAYLNDVDSEGLMLEVPHFFSFQNNTLSPIPIQEKSKTGRVAVFPGSVWATKQWTEEGFSELVRLFTQAGYSVDLMGGPSEKKLCDEIALANNLQNVQILAGKLSVSESIDSLKNYDLVVSNDSASTHMAAFNGVPVVTIFGPTVLSMGFRPWCDHLRIVQNTEMACRPCGRHGHRQCPLGHHLCMKTIGARAVFAKAKELLQNS